MRTRSIVTLAPSATCPPCAWLVSPAGGADPMKGLTMRKADAMKRWAELEPGQDPLKVMVPIQPKTHGSRYGCDGIRIDGSPEFIDSVLSCLKTILDGENQVTRLELARNTVKPQPGYKAGLNAAPGSEVCYIRLHVRGPEGAMASAFFDKDLKPATERYANRLGVV